MGTYNDPALILPGAVGNTELGTGAVTDAKVNAAAAINTSKIAIPPGTIWAYAGAAAPTGWVLCDGASLDRATYAALFAAIGTAYGNVDGSHFNVPDLLGRSIIGAGAGSGLTARARGDKSGEETHIISTAELASHSHSHTHDTIAAHSHSHTHNTIADHTHTAQSNNTGSGGTGTNFVGQNAQNQTGNINAGGGHTHTADATTGGGHTHAADATTAGSGTAHNTMQPFGVANYIIKT